MGIAVTAEKLPNATGVAIAKSSIKRQRGNGVAFEENVWISHRHGSKDRPEPLSEIIKQERVAKKIPTAPERTPLAFCVKCNCDRPMKWKVRDKRGKKVDDWFVCAVCSCDCLEIKRINHAEAVKINLKNGKEKYE